MDTLDNANQLADKAGTEMNQGKPLQAIKTYQEAKELFVKFNDLKKAAGMQHMIGVCYNINDNLDAATQAFKLAINDYQKAHEPMGSARVARDIGLMFINHDMLKEAEQSLKQSEQEIKALPPEEMRDAELGITLAKLGYLYTLLKQLDEAEKYLTDGLALIRKTGHAFYELTALMHLAALYFKTKNYDRMLTKSQAALGIIYEFDMYDKQTRRLAEIYALIAEGYMRSEGKDFAEHFAKKSLDMIKQLEPDAQKLVRKYIESEDLQAFSGLG